MAAVEKEADLLAAGGDENSPQGIGDFRRQAGTTPYALGEILQHGEIDEIGKVQRHVVSSPVRNLFLCYHLFLSAAEGAARAMPEKEPFPATLEFAMVSTAFYSTEEPCP